jgi:large subunit ribosomal protein L15
MTDKKRRQRGSRTHGGGSQKNRRGAGNRGGRGKAGRDKHEIHNYEPLGKSGFSRPDSLKETVATVNLQEISEAGFYSGTSVVFASDLTDLDDADSVKVLGKGQLRQDLMVVADQFSSSAIEEIESAGGQAKKPEEVEIKMKDKNNDDMEENEGYLDDLAGIVEEGEPLEPEQINKALEEGVGTGEIEYTYEIILDGVENTQDHSPDHILQLYRLQYAMEEAGLGTYRLESVLDEYFSERASRGRKEEIKIDDMAEMTPEDVANGLRELEEEWEKQLGDAYNPMDSGLEDAKKDYLFSVREALA